MLNLPIRGEYQSLKPCVLKGIGYTVWCYGLLQTNHHQLNKVIDKFYREVTAPYWAPERQYIDRHYQDIPIPFKQIEAPSFAIQKNLELNELVSYFATWSPVNTLLKQTGESLIDTWLKPNIEALNIAGSIECQWPISLIVSRKS